jgi:hypothetical protein
MDKTGLDIILAEPIERRSAARKELEALEEQLRTQQQRRAHEHREATRCRKAGQTAAAREHEKEAEDAEARVVELQPQVDAARRTDEQFGTEERTRRAAIYTAAERETLAAMLPHARTWLDGRERLNAITSGRQRDGISASGDVTARESVAAYLVMWCDNEAGRLLAPIARNGHPRLVGVRVIADPFLRAGSLPLKVRKRLAESGVLSTPWPHPIGEIAYFDEQRAALLREALVGEEPRADEPVNARAWRIARGIEKE